MVVIMRSLKALLLLGLILVPSVSLFGQAMLNGPEVDTAAVIRRGDHVEHVDGIQSEADAAWGEVTAPPADDSHKWFITVLTMKNCGPCNQLKADWQTSQHLRAFAIPGDQKNSWAHINFYDVENETHAWWQKNLKISGYPTILIQPPRTKQYGDPSTVVFQKTGYNGKPEELAAKMSAGMKTYVAKLAQHRSTLAIQKPASPKSGGFQAIEYCEHGGDTRTDPVAGTWGQFPIQGPPPFNVPNPNAPSPATPPPLVIPDAVNPDAQPTPAPEKELPSVLKKPDSLCVVVDPELLSSSEEKRAGIKRLLTLLREKYPQAEPRLINPEQAKLEFPSLDTTKPQVILTSGGKLLTQIPQAILDELLKDQPELQTAAKLLAALGAVVPWAQWGVVGLAVFVVFRAWKKQKQNPAAPATPVDPNAPAPADPELKFGEGKLLKMIEDAVAKALNK